MLIKAFAARSLFAAAIGAGKVLADPMVGGCGPKLRQLGTELLNSVRVSSREASCNRPVFGLLFRQLKIISD